MHSRCNAPTHRYRTALVWSLCLLAALFAVEAKMAWYGPTSGVGSDVRASKAMPADAPELVEHGIPVPDPIHPHILFAVLSAPFVDAPQVVPVSHEWLKDRPREFAKVFLSSPIFFRPPPALF